MATKEEIEALKRLLGAKASALTDDQALSSNVVNLVGRETVSPAGTMNALPMAPTVLSPLTERPKMPEESVLSRITNYMLQPATSKFLGQMAQAMSGPHQNSVGAQLGRFGVAGAEERSEARLLTRAMRGEDPFTAAGADVGAATPEARRRVAGDLAAQRAEAREQEKLGLEERQVAAHERNVESTITAREAATFNDEARLWIEGVKTELDARRVDLAADQQEWEQQFREQQNEWQSQVGLSAASENIARRDLLRIQGEMLQSGRTMTGGLPGGRGGGSDWHLGLSRLQTINSKNLEDHKALYLSPAV